MSRVDSMDYPSVYTPENHKITVTVIVGYAGIHG